VTRARRAWPALGFVALALCFAATGVRRGVADDAPALEAEPNVPTAPQSIPRRLGGELASDFRWSVNSLEADAEDVVKSPLHVGDLLTNPDFYWTTLASGAALGGAYALDEPARRQFRHISPADATHLESWGTVALWAGTGLMYGYGLAVDDSRAREYALTSLLSVGVSSGLTTALKVSFGRLRPNQNKGHDQWFQGGASFVSGATTPAFALAAGISEYADNRWYVALPAYTAATAVGLGRMGKDAHWLSDVVGSALLGVGTTELFLHMHALHAKDPSRYRIFPVAVRGGAGLGVSVAF
jgi:membrane-associated phospholipid phosphatase